MVARSSDSESEATIIFYRCLLPAGSARRAALPVFRLFMGRFWGFSPRRGDTLHLSRSNLAGRADPAPHCQIWPWSVQGWGFTAPKTEKNSNFTNIIAHKERVPCTIFTKFIGFMRVLSLHNFAKFGCFISINEKIINNLLRWGRFQPNFRRPLAGKTMDESQNVLDLKWWHGPPLSPCKISWKSRDARLRERMKCDVFHFIYLFVTLHGRRLLWCVVDLLPEDITSTFCRPI